jgi:hypothetical protein
MLGNERPGNEVKLGSGQQQHEEKLRSEHWLCCEGMGRYADMLKPDGRVEWPTEGVRVAYMVRLT